MDDDLTHYMKACSEWKARAETAEAKLAEAEKRIRLDDIAKKMWLESIEATEARVEALEKALRDEEEQESRAGRPCSSCHGGRWKTSRHAPGCKRMAALKEQPSTGGDDG